MTPEQKEFLARMEALSGTLAGGAAVSKAAGTQPDAATAPAGGETVAKSMKDERESGEQVPVVQKCFEELATVSKAAYGQLVSQPVLDDPHGFLRRKSAATEGRPSRYLISDGQLGGMIETLLRKSAGKAGVPLANFGLMQSALEGALSEGAFGDAGGLVSKALDSGAGSAGPLIRTDIEPLLREAYLRKFPALEVIPTIPSNGLTHSYNVRTADGSAVTVSEMGDLVAAGADSQSTFSRKANANIAILASRRGISLKAQFAVAQSGMPYDLSGPDNLEVIGAMQAIARLDQKLMLQGNFSTAAKTLNDEEGVTDGNGYDGLRTLLKGAGTSITKGADTYLDAIDRAVGQIINAGGDVDNLLIQLSVGSRRAVNQEFQQVLRVTNQAPAGGFANNLSANGVVTVADIVSKFQNIPASAQAQGLGYYTLDGGATFLEDINVIDPNGLRMAYLGSPTPVVLELPVGFNNQLSNVYIIFLMHGLVLYIDSFHRKVRVPRQTV